MAWECVMIQVVEVFVSKQITVIGKCQVALTWQLCKNNRSHQWWSL